MILRQAKSQTSVESPSKDANRSSSQSCQSIFADVAKIVCIKRNAQTGGGWRSIPHRVNALSRWICVFQAWWQLSIWKSRFSLRRYNVRFLPVSATHVCIDNPNRAPRLVYSHHVHSCGFVVYTTLYISPLPSAGEEKSILYYKHNTGLCSECYHRQWVHGLSDLDIDNTRNFSWSRSRILLAPH